MILYFLYRKSNGEVVSYSEGEITFDNTIFNLEQLEITDEQYQHLLNNEKSFIINNELIFE